MFELLSYLAPFKILVLLIKPVVRLIAGLIVAPLSKLFLHRVVRLNDLDEELEKDLAQWIRGATLLLIASANMEAVFFKWVPPEWRDEHVWLLAMRLLLAIGVIEQMPDQALFSIIHPGPSAPLLKLRTLWSDLRDYLPKLLNGFVCQHLNRSSPVLAILCVFLPGRMGWICYGLAITNYLIIGLVSSKDKALGVLQQFDAAMVEKRKELELELGVQNLVDAAPPTIPGNVDRA